MKQEQSEEAFPSIWRMNEKVFDQTQHEVVVKNALITFLNQLKNDTGVCVCAAVMRSESSATAKKYY